MTGLVSENLPLKGLKCIVRKPLTDERGSFGRVFCAGELAQFGWRKAVAQINHSFTKNSGTVRGLHFQRQPFREMKLVSVLRGQVWDVAVDLRPDSDTYLRWHAELLSLENGCAMLIPEGFAHGFQSLCDDVELLYCHTAPYTHEVEGGLNPLDETLTIDWPIAITSMSMRDRNLPRIDSNFVGVPDK